MPGARCLPLWALTLKLIIHRDRQQSSAASMCEQQHKLIRGRTLFYSTSCPSGCQTISEILLVVQICFDIWVKRPHCWPVSPGTLCREYTLLFLSYTDNETGFTSCSWWTLPFFIVSYGRLWNIWKCTLRWKHRSHCCLLDRRSPEFESGLVPFCGEHAYQAYLLMLWPCSFVHVYIAGQ